MLMVHLQNEGEVWGFFWIIRAVPVNQLQVALFLVVCVELLVTAVVVAFKLPDPYVLLRTLI